MPRPGDGALGPEPRLLAGEAIGKSGLRILTSGELKSCWSLPPRKKVFGDAECVVLNAADSAVPRDGEIEQARPAATACVLNTASFSSKGLFKAML